MRGVEPAAALAAVPRLKGLYRRLLEGGRPVQFRTFHAWFAGLLRNAPLAVLRELGLPSNYELLEDDAEARGHTWRPFFEAVTADKSALADYYAVVATHGRSQTAKALGEALSKRVEFSLSDAENAVQHFSAFYPSLEGLQEPTDALRGEPVRRRWLDRAAALGRESNKTPQKAAEAIIDVFGTGEPATESLPARSRTCARTSSSPTEDRLNKNLLKFPPPWRPRPSCRCCAARRRSTRRGSTSSA
jgi:ATP-dependent helicase/nuclease subunit A